MMFNKLYSTAFLLLVLTPMNFYAQGELDDIKEKRIRAMNSVVEHLLKDNVDTIRISTQPKKILQKETPFPSKKSLKNNGLLSLVCRDKCFNKNEYYNQLDHVFNQLKQVNEIFALYKTVPALRRLSREDLLQPKRNLYLLLKYRQYFVDMQNIYLGKLFIDQNAVESIRSSLILVSLLNKQNTVLQETSKAITTIVKKTKPKKEKTLTKNSKSLHKKLTTLKNLINKNDAKINSLRQTEDLSNNATLQELDLEIQTLQKGKSKLSIDEQIIKNNEIIKTQEEIIEILSQVKNNRIIAEKTHKQESINKKKKNKQLSTYTKENTKSDEKLINKNLPTLETDENVTISREADFWDLYSCIKTNEKTIISLEKNLINLKEKADKINRTLPINKDYEFQVMLTKKFLKEYQQECSFSEIANSLETLLKYDEFENTLYKMDKISDLQDFLIDLYGQHIKAINSLFQGVKLKN